MLLWEIMTFGNLPNFSNESILNGEILEQPHNCPEEIYKLMKECWHMTPHTRFDMTKIKSRLKELEKNEKENNAHNIIEESLYFPLDCPREQDYFKETFSGVPETSLKQILTNKESLNDIRESKKSSNNLNANIFMSLTLFRLQKCMWFPKGFNYLPSL